MNVIPQRVRDGFGKLIEPLAVVFIRLHIRPNLITTVGTLVVIASATAFGLGWVRPGGLLLLVSGLFDLLDGRVARRPRWGSRSAPSACCCWVSRPYSSGPGTTERCCFGSSSFWRSRPR